MLISLSFEESGGVMWGRWLPARKKKKTNNVVINLSLPKRGTASEVAGCKSEIIALNKKPFKKSRYLPSFQPPCLGRR